MYSVRKITPELTWVGANDLRLTLFENIHPIPRGVSYNSYLLANEAGSVLLDTADWAVCNQLLENIAHVLQGRELDYVLLHHMEPDHAASLQVVLDRYPNAKVIASAQAFLFLEQFGFSTKGHERIMVKDGEELTLCGHRFTFLSAPMVHWPEVLVSFDHDLGAFFSADAFGTFGALNGKLFNDEVDFDRDWLSDARRYYANIVGKYGIPTQTILKKVSPLLPELKFICPLHGPVWRSDFSYFVNKYDKWSRYVPEQKGVLIACASMYGNTESAAQALACALTERGVEVVLRDVSSTHVSELVELTFQYSHVVLACPTYNGGIFPPMRDYIEDLKALFVKGRTFALLDNGTWAPAAGQQMAGLLAGLSDNTLLNPRLSLRSTLSADRAEELEQLADAVAQSVKG